MNTRTTYLFLRFALGLVLLCSLVLGDVSPASAAQRCYVKADAKGQNNGTSWEDAFIDLQSALGGPTCTEVWVAAGTYRPTSGMDRTISFVLKNGVALYGGFVGTETLLTERDPVANPTILSGNIGVLGSSDNSYHVVVGYNADGSALLDGFRITAGNADATSSPHNGGGGMYNHDGSSPSLVNITFSGNSARYGGGMWNALGGSPTLVNVTFSNNSATGDIGNGGGMYNSGTSNPSLVNVTFNNNSATGNIGNGGAMFNDYSSPSLVNVTFSGNSATNGGGMANTDDSSPSLTNVTFSGNSALQGGGMYNSGTSLPNLLNVTFSSNSATNGGGGGMFNYRFSSPTLTNVTFSGNSAPYGGGIHNYQTSSPIIRNSILYGDTGGEISNVDSSGPTVSYSIVQGGYAGTGNLNANPLLGPLQNNGGFTKTRALGFGSPAIDAGDNVACPLEDQRGVARPQDGDGNGTAICDMGATETPNLLTTTFQSRATQDGWVLESTETSGVGGMMNASQTTFALGDDAADRQGRSILSFNTAGLPDTAVIASATLKIRYAGAVGTNPFRTHGNVLVDVRRGAFSNNAALQLQDFQAAAHKNGALTIKNNPVDGWYTGVMAAANLRYINKRGVTQFRLRFTKDDNDDLSLDYIKFYSGNSVLANRPQLIIKYYVP